MSLGENIKKRREELKMSQEYLAEQIGVSRQAVSKWEKGQSEPTAGNLIQLAHLLETTLSDLVEPEKKEPAAVGEEEKKKPNLILRANLIRLAITAQTAFLFTCTSFIYQIQSPDFPNKELYRGGLLFFMTLLLASSVWMALNHRYEPDLKQRSKNTKIELGYCCVQLFVALLTIRFGMGLAGAVLMIAAASFYILYINPRFMRRKLTK